MGPTLRPGDRIETLQAVPARFVQLSTSSSHEVSRLIEAVETQRAARRQHWTALPNGTQVQVFGGILFKEGDDVKECPHSQDRATCARCRISDVVGAIRGDRELAGELATICRPYIRATDRFDIKLASSGCKCAVSSHSVQPVVKKSSQLARLEQFQCAQRQARECRMYLPVGQLVELDGRSLSGNFFNGQAAIICDPFDQDQRCYTVRLKRSDQELRTQQDHGQALMAEQFGVNDLFNFNLEQMRELWLNFGLSTHGLRTPDAFIEQAMTFLPEVRPEPIIIPAACVSPIIGDAEEVLALVERHTQGLQNDLGTSSLQPSQPGGGYYNVCKKCGDPILGTVIRRGSEVYHYGCTS